MNGDQRIVVGVDGSEFSTTALRLAGRMSTALNIPLEVITCLGTSDFFLASHLPEDRTPTLDELEETAERLVDQALERAFGESRPEGLTRSVKFGAPAKVLVEESQHAEMLVVGRRGKGGFLHQVMGSVSAAVAAHSHCPVVVVGPESDDPRGRTSA
ncbi:universal stress protein [Arthrobacter sp. NicSoilC12]|uniref:universal stress protein n=1 Tax=Arthrobacter sp. NicSoilC12 TaxID=2831001 RepID=UPI001CC492E6|nr:universal stress protein [Arthrobacter sp. NicSoilC12]GIU54440.1 universal stress protein [Arthrobacter sp. NicSoilC12]